MPVVPTTQVVPPAQQRPRRQQAAPVQIPLGAPPPTPGRAPGMPSLPRARGMADGIADAGRAIAAGITRRKEKEEQRKTLGLNRQFAGTTVLVNNAIDTAKANNANFLKSVIAAGTAHPEYMQNPEYMSLLNGAIHKEDVLDQFGIESSRKLLDILKYHTETGDLDGTLEQLNVFDERADQLDDLGLAYLPSEADDGTISQGEYQAGVVVLSYAESMVRFIGLQNKMQLNARMSEDAVEATARQAVDRKRQISLAVTNFHGAGENDWDTYALGHKYTLTSMVNNAATGVTDFRKGGGEVLYDVFHRANEDAPGPYAAVLKSETKRIVVDPEAPSADMYKAWINDIGDYGVTPYARHLRRTAKTLRLLLDDNKTMAPEIIRDDEGKEIGRIDYEEFVLPLRKKLTKAKRQELKEHLRIISTTVNMLESTAAVSRDRAQRELTNFGRKLLLAAAEVENLRGTGLDQNEWIALIQEILSDSPPVRAVLERFYGLRQTAVEAVRNSGAVFDQWLPPLEGPPPPAPAVPRGIPGAGGPAQRPQDQFRPPLGARNRLGLAPPALPAQEGQ